MQKDLIIDCGMCGGEDTEFYLRKGFRVAAVEALPAHVEAVSCRLSQHIDSGRLRIFNVAIADHNGTCEFFINREHDDWGTADIDEAAYMQGHGAIEKVTVPAKPFSQVLDETGVPYYLKIDLNGSDHLCIDALKGRELPRYLSTECELGSFAEIFGQLARLWSVGYRRFKLVNQGLNHIRRCPNPPLEGVYVAQEFSGRMSGPFGAESPGRWKEPDALLRQARRIVWNQRMCGMNGVLWNTPLRWPYLKFWRLLREPVAWFDIHATM